MAANRRDDNRNHKMSSVSFTDKRNEVVYLTQPTRRSVNSLLDEDSMSITCPYCKAKVDTYVNVESSSATHCAAACMVVACLCPLMFLPYRMQMCKEVNHYCPVCHSYIGTYDVHRF